LQFLIFLDDAKLIDGGYFGARLSHGTTAGLLLGSTPDPHFVGLRSQPAEGGGFINFQGGAFENFRYTSTPAPDSKWLKWKINRCFAFFENGLSYKRYLSIYQALQADSPAGNQAVAAAGPGIGRSFTTLRCSPSRAWNLM